MGAGLLVIAGHMDVAKTKQLVAGWLGPWKGDPKAPPLSLAPVPPAGVGVPARQILVTARPGTPQTELRIACRLPPEDRRRHHVHQLLTRVVGGYLGTRLRAQTGVTYGVGGRTQAFAGGATHLVIDTAVDNQRLADVLKAVAGHWRAFAETPFDEGALSQARVAYAGDANLDYQTSSELALEVAATLASGFDLDLLAKRAEDAASITVADLGAAFGTCTRHTVYSLIGEPKVINEALKSAGLPAN